jgi:hypothetical protein
MAKRRKTRRQKISNDRRHIQEVRQDEQAQSVASKSVFTYTPQTAPTRSTVTTTNYQFLKTDLYRTISVTFAIVLAQIVLYFLLKI